MLCLCGGAPRIDLKASFGQGKEWTPPLDQGSRDSSLSDDMQPNGALHMLSTNISAPEEETDPTENKSKYYFWI